MPATPIIKPIKTKSPSLNSRPKQQIKIPTAGMKFVPGNGIRMHSERAMKKRPYRGTNLFEAMASSLLTCIIFDKIIKILLDLPIINLISSTLNLYSRINFGNITFF